MEQTVKKKIGVRDIMTIAAMMVINFAIAMVIGMVSCWSTHWAGKTVCLHLPQSSIIFICF